jgi:hypothetical protein
MGGSVSKSWETIVKQAIRALVIGVASSIGCALAWLYLEPSVGGLLVGVVAGWLASLAYPQLVNLLYWRKSTDTSTEAPPFSVLIVVVTTVALTFVFIHVFQQYTLDVETNR